jgi:hypothetical protein
MCLRPTISEQKEEATQETRMLPHTIRDFTHFKKFFENM